MKRKYGILAVISVLSISGCSSFSPEAREARQAQREVIQKEKVQKTIKSQTMTDKGYKDFTERWRDDRLREGSVKVYFKELAQEKQKVGYKGCVLLDQNLILSELFDGSKQVCVPLPYKDYVGMRGILAISTMKYGSNTSKFINRPILLLENKTYWYLPESTIPKRYSKQISFDRSFAYSDEFKSVLDTNHLGLYERKLANEKIAKKKAIEAKKKEDARLKKELEEKQSIAKYEKYNVPWKGYSKVNSFGHNEIYKESGQIKVKVQQGIFVVRGNSYLGGEVTFDANLSVYVKDVPKNARCMIDIDNKKMNPGEYVNRFSAYTIDFMPSKDLMNGPVMNYSSSYSNKIDKSMRRALGPINPKKMITEGLSYKDGSDQEKLRNNDSQFPLFAGYISNMLNKGNTMNVQCNNGFKGSISLKGFTESYNKVILEI